MPPSRRRILRTLSGGLAITIAGCSTGLGTRDPSPTVTDCPGARGLVQLSNDDDTAHVLEVDVVEQPDGPTVFEDSVDISPGQIIELEAYDSAGSFDVNVRLTETGEEASGSVYSSPSDCTQTESMFRVTSLGELEYRGSIMLE